MQILFEVYPYFKFGSMTANATICEAFKDEKKVHILGFDVGQGSQYINLIKAITEKVGDVKSQMLKINPGVRPYVMGLTDVFDMEGT